MTAESDKSSILSMQVCAASCEPLAAPLPSSAAADPHPAKRQRIDAHPAVMCSKAWRDTAPSAEQVQQQPHEQRARLANGRQRAASSDSICQEDAATELCQTLEPAERGATPQTSLQGQQGQTELQGYGTAQDKQPAPAPDEAAASRSKRMRTNMPQAAAVISTSLPGHSESREQQLGTGEAAAAVSKREMKRQGFVPMHGNYHRYYGYRIGQAAFEEDARLKVGHIGAKGPVT